MSEPKIIIGSVWAHGNGEETVTDAALDAVYVNGNGYLEETFRRVFRHVRDPEPPAPKVGEWYFSANMPDTPVRCVARNGTGVTLERLIRWETSRSLCADLVECAPPEREAAIARLVEAVEAAPFNSDVRIALAAFKEAK